jgi:DnaK suppressor protein
MPRQNALLRLHKNLLACRERLGKKLTGELAYLHGGKDAHATGDIVDLAFEAGGDEVSLRLAELDDRELCLIDSALARWQQGLYGACESCQKPISLARLNALPYTPFCISCEREIEKCPDARGRQSTGRWGRIFDPQAPMQDQRVNLLEVERGFSASRRG